MAKVCFDIPGLEAGVSDHGALTGLIDDDHTQYLLADGSRPLDGNLVITGTVDGRDIATDGSKLDGIQAGSQINADLASQGEAEAGIDNTKTMTALRVAQAIAALAGGGGLQNNLAASVAPTSTDDTASGFSVGSLWIDTVNDEAYRCVNATNSAAIWIKTTLEASDLAAVASSGNSDDLTQGTSNLLMTQAERTKLAGLSASSSAYTGSTAGAIPFVNTDLSLTENASYASLESNGRTTLRALAGSYREENDTATVDFDLSTSNCFTVILGGNRTLSVSNAKIGQVFFVRLEQDTGGSRTVNWWNTINWPSGTAPVLTTTASRADWFQFVCIGENTFDCILRTFNLPAYIEPIY